MGKSLVLNIGDGLEVGLGSFSKDRSPPQAFVVKKKYIEVPGLNFTISYQLFEKPKEVGSFYNNISSITKPSSNLWYWALKALEAPHSINCMLLPALARI